MRAYSVMGFMLERLGFTFCYFSCQVPKMDKDLRSQYIRFSSGFVVANLEITTVTEFSKCFYHPE